MRLDYRKINRRDAKFELDCAMPYIKGTLMLHYDTARRINNVENCYKVVLRN